MLQCHGTNDPVIYYKWGSILAELMTKMNPKYDYKSYEGLGHAVNDQVCIICYQYPQLIKSFKSIVKVYFLAKPVSLLFGQNARWVIQNPVMAKTVQWAYSRYRKSNNLSFE